LSFAFTVGEKVTFREWAMPTGGYEWALPEDQQTWTECFTAIGESFDDGRYRQASFEATKPDCRDTLVRI
jgi:hypothetical protein